MRRAGYIAGLTFLGCCSTASWAALPLQSCQLESAIAHSSIKARCGSFEVAENRDAADSPHIRLQVAVLPALRKEPLPDPLVIISGGPGQAASDFYLANSQWFERLRRDRDIVVIDQRGTGKSQPLDCKLPDELQSAHVDAQLIERYTRECLKQLHGDPRFYSTSVAVRDLDDIRAALGYRTINLYGISYGTRVAQHFLRRYPQHVRSAVLDGVVPVGLALGPDIAPNAQRALDAILLRCAAQRECNAAFPQLKTELESLYARLAKGAIPLTVADPATAVPKQLNFDQSHLAVALRLHSYSDDTASLLPFLIHEAAQNRLEPMAAQALLLTRELGEQIANGMHNAVVCTEDVPFIDAKSLADPAIDRSYLQRVLVDTLLTMCSVWPRGTLDEDFRAPLASDVPTLLLSGENDPVTPATYGERAARSFKHGLHVVFPGQGHGQLPSSCGASLVRRFVESGTTDKLDTECVKRVAAAPFMIDANGPAP